MSQTETLMVLALGAVLTLVVVLLFGRVLWSWSFRASTRRQAKKVPIEMLELQADRDRLRAEHAIMARKLDLRLNDIKTRMAEQMAEVSRNRNRVQSLLKELEQKDNALEVKKSEIADLSMQLDTTRAELDAAHRSIETMNSEAARHDLDMSRLQGAFKKLNVKLREKANLADDITSDLRHALGAEDVYAPAAAPEKPSRLRQRTAEITALSNDVQKSTEDLMTGVFMPSADTQIKTPALPQSVTSALQEKMDQTSEMTAELERDLKEIDKMIALSNPRKPAEEARPQKKNGTMANVISLAQRIRQLQKGLDE